jgi:hypothetical protein
LETVALSGQQTAFAVEQPVRWPADNRQYGSDVIAETIRALGIEFVALTPGSRRAIATVEAGGIAVVDVRVAPGYESGAAANSTNPSSASKG